jgi:HAD superfamily hydrolase (TIGR01509 family)
MLTRVPLRAVLFDWDGTLLDSYQADARAYLAMFQALGIPWGLSELAQHYSPDWHCVYRAASLPPERWAEADRLWRHFYLSERPALQPGARHVLQRIARRYRLGLVTSGSAWRVRAQLRAFGLGGLFSARVFAEESPRRKPHPAPLLLALRRIGCEPAACLYVGDAPEDVAMARRAGVPVVGVMGHSPVPERLRQARPDALIARIAALPGLLVRRNERAV